MGSSIGGAGRATPPAPMDLVRAAIRVHGRGHDELFDEIIAALLTAPRDPLAADLTACLACRVAERWDRGWQPADLHRVIARQLGGPEARLLAGSVVADSARYRALGDEVAPRWMDQVDALARRTAELATDGEGSWVDHLLAMVRLLHALEQLPDLPLLEPPPSAWHARMGTTTDVDRSDPVLDEVRGLLAEAEYSDLDAEARTAEAQVLLARRRFDRALRTSDGSAPAEEVVARRVAVDVPYADAKASLLAGVCVANGARAVWTEEAGFTTAFGHPGDLDVVEELFASLLVQSARALRREGSKRDRFGRSRTTRFRRAFLQTSAQRLASRLRAVVDATLDADDRSGRLRAALAARDAAVERAVAAAFPDVIDVTRRADAREEWVAPTLFDEADDACLGDLLERRPAERRLVGSASPAAGTDLAC